MAGAREMLDASVSERDFQGFIVSFAGYHGWLLFHAFDSRRSEPGFPDLVLVRDDRLIFAECKTEKGKVTVPQQKWLDALGAVESPPTTRLWRPRDAPEVMKELT